MARLCTLPGFIAFGGEVLVGGDVKMGQFALKSMFAAVVMMFGTVASATTLSFYNNAATQDTLRANITCNSCSGLVAGILDGSNPPTWSDIAQLFSLSSSGVASEQTFLNGELGTGYGTPTQNTPSNCTYDSGGSCIVGSFTTNAAYILFKMGNKPNYGIIQNLGGNQTFTYTQVASGSGFSHYDLFGVSPVPLPATGLLLIGAVGAFGFMRKRRKA